jgi:hypothetical protein
MATIPAHLLVPPEAITVAPPIETKLHDLPLAKLRWEDFERLCLRLVQTRFTVEHCELYGVAGQQQQGIDIYARKDGGKYATYQCKRYQKLSSDELRKLVSLFRSSAWAAKSDEFTLCTSAELDMTQVQDAFEELHTEMAAEGISLVKWDAGQLSRLLKDQPAIVYDFFGAAWVKAFNGEEAYERISATRKLDNAQVAEYRRELRACYAVVFNQYDPGLPTQEVKGETLRLEERFIVPDVYEERLVAPYQSAPGESIQIFGEQDATRQADRREQAQLSDFNARGLLQAAQPAEPDAAMPYRTTWRARVRVDKQLAQHPRAVILGDPGAGKSTLLRYLTLDLLSDTPELDALPQALGVRLPVWLPFAYITRQLTLDERQNLPDMLRQWLIGWGKGHLADLMQQALADERLLLLIDGVDEWSSREAAAQALARIEVQARLYEVPVIYSSRPYGYRLIREQLLNIPQLELASFSRPQQEEFVQRWYAQWLKAIEPGSTSQAVALTASFFVELDKTVDLKPLAENPLLLSILLTQKLRDSTLPRSRVEALRDITEYLIKRRPAKRRYEAGLSEEDTWEFSLEEVVAELAIYLQKHSADGTMLKRDAAKVVEQYLQREMDYEPARARKIGHELLELSANSLGILIEKSSEELSFRHRQFQEYLAAKYLNDSNPDQVREILRTYAAEQTWNQVVLLFFARIPPKKDQEFRNYLSQLTYEGSERAKQYYLRFLRYDVCLRLPSAPVLLAKETLTELQREFEAELDEAIRQPLLRLLLGAAENPRLKRLVFDYFGLYFPYPYLLDDYRVAALRRVAAAQLSSAQQAFLWQALRHGNATTRLQASVTLGEFMTVPTVAERATTLLSASLPPTQAALVLNVLAGPAVPAARKAEAVTRFTDRTTGDLLLFRLKLQVQLGTHTDQHLTELLASARWLGHELASELVSVLATGWPASRQLLATCLASVSNHWNSNRQLDTEVAWALLLQYYYQEEQVLERVIQEVRTEQFPFNSGSNMSCWQWLAANFRDNPRLVPVIDEWLAKQKYLDSTATIASLVGRTPVARQVLLAQLPQTSFPHWPVMSLMQGWHDDPQVRAELKAYFRGATPRKDFAAYYLPQVFVDEPQEAVAIAKDILFDRSAPFRDRALAPLLKLDSEYFKTHLLDQFLADELPELSKGYFAQYYAALQLLAEYFGTDERVQALVFAPDGPPDGHLYEVLIRCYPEAIEAIDHRVGRSLPLAAADRLQLIDRLGERYVADTHSLMQLANFEVEADDRLRCEAAVRYFQLSPDQEAVRAVCSRLAFYRGTGHEANRQLAFIGFLLRGELATYFALHDEKEGAPNPDFRFRSDIYGYEAVLLPLLTEHFATAYAEIGGDWARIAQRHSQIDEEDILSALANYALAGSLLENHLLQYATTHASTLHRPGMLAFLARQQPGSELVKQVALRLVQSEREGEWSWAANVLAQQYVTHPEVYDAVADIQDSRSEGKILAATLGWPMLPKLGELFAVSNSGQLQFESVIRYALNFLFWDVTTVASFLTKVRNASDELQLRHRFFVQPLLARVQRDKEVQAHLLTILQEGTHPALTISAYALLEQTARYAADLAAWRRQPPAGLAEYGYNIVENRVMSLSETLHDIWYQT